MFGTMKLSFLLLSCSALAMKVRLRQGHDHELAKDTLFNKWWTNTTAVPHVGAEDSCASWEGNPICFIEAPEHELVKTWLPEDAKIMEFGARFGTTTCEIAKKLKNSGNIVTVEPDVGVWSALENNLKHHNCNAHVLRGAVSSQEVRIMGSGYGGRSQTGKSSLRAGSAEDLQHPIVPSFTFDQVEKAVGFKIDTLLIDCEGCAQDMMDQLGPKIQDQIKLVLIEADMPDSGGDCTKHCMNYKKFFKFLDDAGFEQIDEFNDCNHHRSGSPETTWCGPWINHYAFRRLPWKGSVEFEG